MKKLFLSTLLLMFAICGLARADYPVRTKVYFNIHVPYTVKAGEIMVPAGDYTLRDLGVSTNAVLALTKRNLTQPIAILFTVRIDRRLVDYTDKPRVVFDLEGGTPSMKRIYLPSEDGYEIISAIGDKEYRARAGSNVTRTTTVTTEEKVETAPAPKVEPTPEPAPKVEETPAPAPEPKVEPAPAPTPEPVAPIKERKRVRKD